MRKERLLTLAGAALAIAIYWLGFVNGIYYYEHKTDVELSNTVLSDEEIMNFYIADNYGQEYYGVFDDDNDDDRIEFLVYEEDGTLHYLSSIDRDYYNSMYTQN